MKNISVVFLIFEALGLQKYKQIFDNIHPYVFLNLAFREIPTSQIVKLSRIEM